jgi:hypothetical protein
MTGSLCAALLVVGALGPGLTLQEPAPSGPVFELELASGPRRPWTPPEGAPWTPAGDFVLPEGALVARLSQGLLPPEPVPAEDRISLALAGGDRLEGRSSGGRGDDLLLEVSGALLALDVELVRSLRFPARLPSDPGLVLEAPPSGDRLYRRVAARLDRVDGTLDGFSAEGVAFESLVGLQTIPWEELAALFIEGLGADPAPPRGPRALVLGLADGSRLRGELISWGRDRVSLRLPSGDSLALPTGAIAQLEAADGRLSFLSDLTALEVEPSRPFGDDLGMVWWPRPDLCVSGGPLLAGGRRHLRGFGVAAPTRLAFGLEGSWRELRGAVAIDDSVLTLGLTGSVRFRVLVDGQVRFESPELSRADGILELPAIDLAGASRVEFLTEMGSDLFEGDRADWLELRLLR